VPYSDDLRENAGCIQPKIILVIKSIFSIECQSLREVFYQSKKSAQFAHFSMRANSYQQALATSSASA
jgi:hypothetical protein